MISASWCEPSRRRHFLLADWHSLKTIVSADEARWRHHRLAVGDMSILGRHFRSATATPLDAHAYAGFPTPAQYSAGDQLRTLWRLADREPKVTGSLEPYIKGSVDEMSDEAAAAWRCFSDALTGLEPVAAGIVYDVACFGRGAEAWARRNGKPEWIGLIVLREALEALAEHMRGGRRKRSGVAVPRISVFKPTHGGGRGLTFA